jgi:prepilin signal peptidase PulO-like enzyme (type II secretory pathway)
MPFPLFVVVPLSAVIGLLVGSFLATLVLRLPKREPIVFARSACPRCGHVLGPGELIPVLSWLLQGRRCRACGVPISGFYAVMEIASALVAGAAVWFAPWPEYLVLGFAGWAALCVAAWIVRAAL